MNPVYNVAVVEDDDTWNHIIYKHLLDSPYFKLVLACKSSKEFLTKHKEFKLDLVIVDIRLPGTMQGMQLAKKIREKNAEIPIMIFSSAVNDMRKEVFLHMGVFGLDKSSTDDLHFHVTRMLLHNTFKPTYEVLTTREKELLHCIKGGLTDDKTATRMYTTPSSIEKWKRHLAYKLGFDNKAIHFIQFFDNIKV